jgi:hypothetical protein
MHKSLVISIFYNKLDIGEQNLSNSIRSEERLQKGILLLQQKYISGKNESKVETLRFFGLQEVEC